MTKDARALATSPETVKERMETTLKAIDTMTEQNRIRATFATRHRDKRYTWSDPAYTFMMQGIERRVLGAMSRSGLSSLSGKRVLEIGCGSGHWLRELVQWGVDPRDVVGVDLVPSRLHDAERLCAKGVRVYCGDGGALALRSDSFDVVMQVTVFTSILDPDLKRRVALEMLRVVKQDGLILWYDFHIQNPANPNVRAVGKREIRDLFPGCAINLRRLTLAPPLTRILAPRSWLLCHGLESISLLCTHYLGVIRKR